MVRLVPLSLIMTLLPLSACRKAQDEEEVVARVGRAVITQAEFQHKLAEVAPGFQTYVATPHGRRQFLDVLIREKLMLEAAKADGVADSPEFRERMADLKRDEEAKLREAHDYLLSKLWVERLREKRLVSADEDEARDYFKKNPVQVQARHILVATADQAEAVLDKVRGGASFAELAKKTSLDGETAADGGRMRPALFGETLPELDVLFKMRVGELGGPVRSKFGYHILHKDGEDRPAFEAVRDRAMEIVEKQKLDRHLQLVQASFRVEVVDEQFK
ncbi:MAG: hypothetical protein FD126_2346 [Elusimicrobia bacterium]|nr:MAG: hypothetical protein FD126_2346 [Elusimicrobiota bacterium]